jgi:hypothetical protein
MTDTRSTPWLAIVLIVLVVLPALYVLSVGPVAWLYLKGHVSLDVFNLVYMPLNFAAAHCQPIGDGLVWYLGLWGFDATIP